MKEAPTIARKSVWGKLHNDKPQVIPIEDEFDILEDAGDQALISFYNDVPTSPNKKVPIIDSVKQGITNLGFLFNTNDSKKVNIAASVKNKKMT